ncbi:MAG: hypothetical protein Q9227_008651 [Pyrenula ochraceoflavens]
MEDTKRRRKQTKNLLSAAYLSVGQKALDIYDVLRKDFGDDDPVSVPAEIRSLPQYKDICSRCLAMTSTSEGLKALNSRAGYKHLRVYQIKRHGSSMRCPLCAHVAKSANVGLWYHTIRIFPRQAYDSYDLPYEETRQAQNIRDNLTFGRPSAVLDDSLDNLLFYHSFRPEKVSPFPSSKDRLGEWLSVSTSVGGVSLYSCKEQKRSLIYIRANKIDNAASKFTKNRSLYRDLYTDETLARLQKWLKDCHRLHKGCAQTVREIPSRVIDVGSSSHDLARLHIKDGTEDSNYAALSYCWGMSMFEARTTQDNLYQRMKEINVKSLPRTLQDAISTTRRLGLQYLWIDAICILQDDTEDKIKEINNMSSIYKNATITIAVADAADSGQGFLKVNERQPPPICQLPLILPDATFGSISLMRRQFAYENDDALGRRGWTMQENLLSQRVVTFKDGNILVHCRSNPVSKPVIPSCLRIFPSRFQSQTKQDDIRFILNDDVGDHVKSDFQKRLIPHWPKIVEDFSRRKFSFPADRLPALSGLAKEFSRVTGDIYLAGLWKSDMINQLCWHRREIEDDAGIDKPLAGPSWSWAQLYSEVFFQSWRSTFSEVTTAEVVDCSVELDRNDAPFGQVKSGRLQIRGKVNDLSRFAYHASLITLLIL